MPNTPAGETFSRASLNPSYLTETDGELQAAFTCLNGEGEQEVVWNENFDGLDENNLGGWTLNNADAFSWVFSNEDFSTIVPGDVHSLFIEGSYRYGDRGTASAISPEISVPQNATLKGYVNYSFNLNEDYCTLTIFASDNSGETWTQVWSDLDDTADKKRYWHELNIDMTAFAGKTATLKFEYDGYMGDYAIDGLQLTAAAEATSIDVMTGETVKFADASTGNPTSWSWSFPGGTPAESTEQYPEVYYTRDGSYDVSLTVSDGTSTSTKTMTAFVNVTGVAPTARIMPPATFRYYETRLPMVAPLVGVQYRDNSTGYPTSWKWTFDGVSPEAYAQVTSTEQNPVVGYSYRHQQAVALHVENEHGGSDDALDVSVEYSGIITNLEPGDQAATFDMEDWGTFPGTNTIGITAYAEKFSKPSRPILVFGAYVYFVTASATSLTDQIADVGVHLYTSENGLPGKKLDSMWWRVFELDTPSGGTLTGTAFEFNPTVIDDEFFIVVDGIPEKNDSVDVSFAMARFRDHGNTAYMYKDNEWVDVSTYFPAGANHTSYLIMPSIVHSVMSPIPTDRGPLVVGKEAGTSRYPFFSIYGYETPVKSDADWCRVVGKPNGLTLDTLLISYDRLPDGIEEREATLTINDSISTYDIRVIQNVNGISAVESAVSAPMTLLPSVFDCEVAVQLPEGARWLMVCDEKGRELYRRDLNGEKRQVTVDASGWTPGVYLFRVAGERDVTVVKGVKR